MWPFKRSKSEESSLPPEVNEYYQAEHRERIGVAWLLGLVTLLLTIGVVFALFFGGRWAYRKITHKNTSQPVAVPKTTSPSSSNSSSSSQSSSSSGSVSAPATPPSPAPSSSQTPPPAPSTPKPAQTATTPANTGTIPNTGPGDVLSIFLVVSAAGAALHYQWQKRSQRI